MVLAILVAVGVVLGGCQEVDQPKTTLTQAEWKKIKDKIGKDKNPDPEYPIGANYDDKIQFIGFDVDQPLRAGNKVTFTWYWKALDTLDENWKVFVHFDSSSESYRQSLDHHPLDGRYRTGRWKEGQVIEDTQEVTIHKDYPAGQAVAYVGFYRGNQRLPIKNDVKKTNDRRVIAPPLTITNAARSGPSNTGSIPTHRLTATDAADLKSVNIDGKLDEKVWKQAARIDLHGLSSAAKLPGRVRVLRSDKNLFIGAHLTDKNVWSTLKKRDSNTWNEEVFEVYVDKGRDAKDYLEFQINPLGTVFDAHYAQRLGRGQGSRDQQIDRAKAWNMTGLESAVHIDGTVNDNSDEDTSWAVELKFPLQQIPGIDAPPKSGQQWAVNFFRYDRPGGPDDKAKQLYAWSKPTNGSFHQIERFGTFKLSDADDAAPRIKPVRLKKMPHLQLKPKLRQIDKRPSPTAEKAAPTK